MYQQLQSIADESGQGSTRFPRSWPTRSSSSRRRSWPDLQRQLRASRARSSATSIPTSSSCVTDPGRRRPSSTARLAKVVQSVRNEYQAALAQERSLTDGAQPAEGRGAGDEPQGHRVRRAGARGGEQPPDFREPDAAHQGDRHLRRAEDEQHPRSWMRRKRPRAPINVEHARNNHAARAARRRRRSASGSRSSSSTSTTGSRCPDEMKQHLGLPFLGMVPALFDKDAADAAHHQRRRRRTSSRASGRSARTCCSRRPRAGPAQHRGDEHRAG